jgi:hypothetical protein
VTVIITMLCYYAKCHYAERRVLFKKSDAQRNDFLRT